MSIRKGGQIIAGSPRETGGVEIGDIGFAPLGIDESLNLRRYLNGQVISQSQFIPFTNKVKSAIALYPNLATTETNWQSEKNLSKLGQCGRFVIDDDAGTIRLPSVVNAQGLTDLQYLGTIKAESLPNISGEFMGGCINHANIHWYETAATNPFYVGDYRNTGAVGVGSAESGYNKMFFNASRSSSTYQDNAPIQQEAIQYPYYIQVATGIEETLPAIREYKVNNSDFFGKSMYSDVAPENASWLVSNGQYNAKSTYPDMWTQLQVELNSSLNKGDTVVIDGKTYVKRGLPVKLSTGTITDYDWVVNTADETFRLPLLDGSEDIPGGEVELISLDTTASVHRVTRNKNGFYSVNVNSSTSVSLICEVNGVYESAFTSDSRTSRCSLFAKAGQEFLYTWSGSASSITSNSGIRFIPAVGNGSLYYYVGDTVQDASLINAGAVLGQLATKTNSVEAAAASMPSNRYIDLTLGASGSTYTAPANGWFRLIGPVGASGYVGNALVGIAASGTTNYGLNITIPVKKGDTVSTLYTSATTFRFVYAQGNQ